ncbi:hypothetical protein AB0I77_15685 [Streptomyces sp. NPDC050619]|uniref:hypothetical protein n=1 Tax=Streptomyces sp. NPDC050619 TaxID=3157214 RepID=UPI003440CDDA
MWQKFRGGYVAVARFKAHAKAAQPVASSDVAAHILGVGVVVVKVAEEGAADVLYVAVANEQVAGAGTEVETQPSAAVVARGVREPVEVVDVEADAATGGGVFGSRGPVAGARRASQKRGGPTAVERNKAGGGGEAPGQVSGIEGRERPVDEFDQRLVRGPTVGAKALGLGGGEGLPGVPGDEGAGVVARLAVGEPDGGDIASPAEVADGPE